MVDTIPFAIGHELSAIVGMTFAHAMSDWTTKPIKFCKFQRSILCTDCLSVSCWLCGRKESLVDYLLAVFHFCPGVFFHNNLSLASKLQSLSSNLPDGLNSARNNRFLMVKLNVLGSRIRYQNSFKV